MKMLMDAIFTIETEKGHITPPEAMMMQI